MGGRDVIGGCVPFVISCRTSGSFGVDVVMCRVGLLPPPLLASDTLQIGDFLFVLFLQHVTDWERAVYLLVIANTQVWRVRTNIGIPGTLSYVVRQHDRGWGGCPSHGV